MTSLTLACHTMAHSSAPYTWTAVNSSSMVRIFLHKTHLQIYQKQLQPTASSTFGGLRAHELAKKYSSTRLSTTSAGRQRLTERTTNRPLQYGNGLRRW